MIPSTISLFHSEPDTSRDYPAGVAITLYQLVSIIGELEQGNGHRSRPIKIRAGRGRGPIFIPVSPGPTQEVA